jgi:hypothetical protein
MFAAILVPIAIFICPTIEGRRLDDGYPNGKQWRDDDGCPDWKRQRDDDGYPN